MARPKTVNPTPAELDVLKLLWDQGPLTVRDVWNVLHARQPRAYTSVMSLLNVMTGKRLLRREPCGRAFRYHPLVSRESTLSSLVSDLWQRVYSGSASTLVAHLLDQSQPGEAELQRIRETLQRFEAEQEAAS